MKYICTVCGTEVKKPALKAVPNWKTAKITDFTTGLGKWKCFCGNKKVKAVAGTPSTKGPEPNGRAGSDSTTRNKSARTATT